MSQGDSLSTRTVGIEALFDLSFTRFITVSMIKVIYILAMVCLALGWIGLVLGGFAGRGFLGGIIMMIVATVGAVLYLLMIRVWLELVVVLFRIGENTSLMAGRSLTGDGQGFPVAPMPATPLV